MKFPAKLTDEDLRMCIKEWKLAGLDVYVFHLPAPFEEVEVKGEAFRVSYAKRDTNLKHWRRTSMLGSAEHENI